MFFMNCEFVVKWFIYGSVFFLDVFSIVMIFLMVYYWIFSKVILKRRNYYMRMSKVLENYYV